MIVDIEKANEFGNALIKACDKLGIDPKERFGFIVGFLYGQLRAAHYADKFIRELFDSSINGAKIGIDALERENKESCN